MVHRQVCAAHSSDLRSSANDSFPVVSYRLRSRKKEKKREEKVMNQMNMRQIVCCICGHALTASSTSTLFSLHVQDVLWHRKPYLKVSGREGRSTVLGVGCRFCYGESESSSRPSVVSHLMLLSLSLFNPTCLHVSVSACRGAHVQHTVNSVTLWRQKHHTLSPSPLLLWTL